MVLALAVMLATPEALVIAEVFDSTALGPLAGAANITMTPLDGLPAASLTVTCSAFVNGWPVAANCGVPLEAVRLAGGPVLVSEKVAIEP